MEIEIGRGPSVAGTPACAGRPSDPARQLAQEFAEAADEHLVSTTLRAARRDLDGQISSEALDEMAYRLAHHRLSERITS